MNQVYKELGKVKLTLNGDWQRDKEYEELSLVNCSFTGKSYVSKTTVPKGIDITNNVYWQELNATGYKNNNFIILSDIDDETGNLKVYTLQEAINEIDEEDRRPGLILGFYGVINNIEASNYVWYLYQYNNDTVEQFTDVKYWHSIYDNVNKFKGYFISEDSLIASDIIPNVGDFCFIGEDFENAVIYICEEYSKWKRTDIIAMDFANKYKAVLSKDFNEFKEHLGETYADRALKDSLGNIIHDTYITKIGLTAFVTEKVINAIWNTSIPDGSITVNSLSENLKKLIVGGNIVNNVDEEDVTIINDVIKFNDKEYDELNFSGYGRKYIRKNIIDGINILEQSQINEANTRYIIQYFHCLNGKTIKIPDNCILDFTHGGYFRNGTIECNNTLIIVPRKLDLDINITGTYEYFGGSSNNSNETNINVVDDLNSTNINAALSANQGRILNEKIDKLLKVLKVDKDEFNNIDKDDNTVYLITR